MDWGMSCSGSADAAAQVRHDIGVILFVTTTGGSANLVLLFR